MKMTLISSKVMETEVIILCIGISSIFFFFFFFFTFLNVIWSSERKCYPNIYFEPCTSILILDLSRLPSSMTPLHSSSHFTYNTLSPPPFLPSIPSINPEL